MPLSNIQKGAIGQYALLAIALATGKGQLEAYIPAADNEGRDAEVRRHLSRLAGIGIQIKVAFSGWIDANRHSVRVSFGVERSRVQDDPRLWFLLGFYDTSRLALHDPVCVVPASVLHEMLRRRSKGRRNTFTVKVTLDPNSHDELSRYRVALKDLGKRLLEIIDSQAVPTSAGIEPLPAGTLVIARRRRRRASKRLRRAA